MNVLLSNALIKLINRVFFYCFEVIKMNVEFIGQLVDSMEQAVTRLEWAIGANNKEEANKMKVFIFDLQGKMTEALK